VAKEDHFRRAAVQDALHSEGVIVTESHNAPSVLMEAVHNPNRERVVSVSS